MRRKNGLPPSLSKIASAALAALVPACSDSGAGVDASSQLYALVQGIDGVSFYPPLGPEPTPAGAFDATLLDGLSVVIEAQGADGVTVLGTFDQTTTPQVALLREHERYWVNIPAATYITDRASIYRVRVLLDGAELAASTLDPHIFDVLAWSPALPLGVQVRIEGSGAVRAVSRSRAVSTGAAAHCSDGRRNKDETGVDCGGSCAPCATCSDGVRNQGEEGTDCGGPCAPCARWTAFGCGMCTSQWGNCGATFPCYCGTCSSSLPLHVSGSTHASLGCATQDVLDSNNSRCGGLYQLYPGSITITAQ